MYHDGQGMKQEYHEKYKLYPCAHQGPTPTASLRALPRLRDAATQDGRANRRAVVPLRHPGTLSHRETRDLRSLDSRHSSLLTPAFRRHPYPRALALASASGTPSADSSASETPKSQS